MRALLRRTGFDCQRYTKDRFAAPRRAHFLRTNKIDVVFDIGAAEGAFARELRQSSYTGRIVSFEPLATAFAALERQAQRDPLWRCLHTALGSGDDEAEMNVSGRCTSSSLLPMSNQHTHAAPESGYVAREKVPVRRLDGLLAELAGPQERIYLKADVQGYEQHVLDGAHRTLGQTLFVELELSLCQLYEGAPPYREMLDLMASLGFHLVSIQGMFSDPKTGHMLQADGIFARLPAADGQ